jgi:multicomponent Na+:H+ antiporter subunit E
MNQVEVKTFIMAHPLARKAKHCYIHLYNKGGYMLFVLFLTLVLTLFWLLLSWHFTPFVLGCGVASIALTLYLALRMKVVDEESQPLHIPVHILGYWMWLAKEVVISTWDVTLHIWNPRKRVYPRVITIDAPPQTPFGLMLYANSMTLTPGTVCLDVIDGRIKAHALTQNAAAGLEQGEMGIRIRRLGL